VRFTVSRENWRLFYRAVKRRISNALDASVTFAAKDDVEVSSRAVVQTLSAEVAGEGQFSIPESGVHLLDRMIARTSADELTFEATDGLLRLNDCPVFCYTACLVSKRGLRKAPRPSLPAAGDAYELPDELVAELTVLARDLSQACSALQQYGVAADNVLQLLTGVLPTVTPAGLKAALVQAGLDTPWASAEDGAD